MSTASPVVIMAGGTGGHVFPALAVAECLRAQDIPVLWIGSRRGLEATLVPAAGFPIEWIDVAGLRGKSLSQRLKAPFMLTQALWQVRGILRRVQPRVVLGMGGFVSGPGGLMARFLGIPLVIHEQNAYPGTTNRWLGRMAQRILQGFPDTFPAARHALTVGNPVRSSIAQLPAPAERFLNRSAPTRLLILGGSQGALALNQLVPQALALLPAAQRPEVWHQAGAQLLAAAQTAYNAAQLEVRLTPFIDNMAEAYAWADLVLCRAGALTIAELTAAGVGAILVPFPFAIDDHQTANAQFMATAGAALLQQQADLTPAILANLLQELLADRARLLHMAQAARSLAKVDAAAQVAHICLTQTAN